MFLVFDGSKAVNEARAATKKATAEAKASGAAFSRITLKGAKAVTKRNRANQAAANSPRAKMVRGQRAAGNAGFFNATQRANF